MKLTPVFESKHVTAQLNPLTMDYLLKPKDGATRLTGHVYACCGFSRASQMAQTMDHYEDTGEQKAFPVNRDYLKAVK